jgi:[NiFe] hydrogenase diaphorase moiety large subunit
MNESMEAKVARICEVNGRSRTRMLEITREVQSELGCVPPKAMTAIARELGVPRVDVEGFVSFYAFLSDHPRGRHVIRLCNCVIDRMRGYERIAELFQEELGIGMGETTEDGVITLESTPCSGMCDQAPSALVDHVVLTDLSRERVREIVKSLRAHGDPGLLVERQGDGNNAHDLVQAMVHNNMRKEGPLLFTPLNRGEAISKALGMSPAEVIRVVKAARVLGRGGAGFPTGMKWDFCRDADGDKKYVLCNADEGEPGTFKDRVLLTEMPDRVFAGMTVAGYAIGAEEGIVYLRGEYAYLRRFLESVLERRRADGLLGKDILPDHASKPFHFDIRIEMGAGAYVCGEETALISSLEGFRGDPKTRPPFPAQKGYLGYPSIVNNVETFCCVAKILEVGAAAFSELGTAHSAGTKLLSVAGDCRRPGVFEVPFGITVGELLVLAAGENAMAVQVGGPSGQLIGPESFHRKIGFEDLATGGSIMVFGPNRNVLEIVHSFLEFFEEESCGYCTPCRVGNVLLKQTLERIMDGRGEPDDLELLETVSRTMKAASRCGLGQTASNPVTSSLLAFREKYEELLSKGEEGRRRSFDLNAAVAEAAAVANREPARSHH